MPEPGLMTDTQYGSFQYFNGIAGIAVSLLGIVTNILNIKVFLGMGVKDGVTTSFLSLSISDLISSILNFADCIAIVLHAYEYYNDTRLCYYDPLFFIIIFANLCFMSYTVTVLNTSYLAFTRCMCVVMPLRFKNIFTKKRAIIVSVLFFVASMVIITPILCKIELKAANNTDCSRQVLTFPADREQVKDPIYLLILTIIPFTSQIIVLICVFVMMTALKKTMNFRKKRGASRKQQTTISDKYCETSITEVSTNMDSPTLTQLDKTLASPDHESEKASCINPLFDLMPPSLGKESNAQESCKRGSISLSVSDITASACSLNDDISTNDTPIEVKYGKDANNSINTETTDDFDDMDAFDETSGRTEKDDFDDMDAYDKTSGRTETDDFHDTDAYDETSGRTETDDFDDMDAYEKTSGRTETCASNETSARTETSASNETSARTETSASSETSARAETSASNETSAQTETSTSNETEVSNETSARTETSASNETSAETETSVSHQTSTSYEPIEHANAAPDRSNTGNACSTDQSKESDRQNPVANESLLTKKESRILHQVILICVLFITCNIPMIMMGLASMFQPGLDASVSENRYVRLYYGLQLFRRDIEQLSSSINIFIYIKYNARFKRGCLQIINRICPCLTSGGKFWVKSNPPSSVSNSERQDESVS